MDTVLDFISIKMILTNIVLFFFGKEIGVENVGTWFVLVTINTMIWIATKDKYGTTIRRIFEKQSMECLMTIGLVFSIKVATCRLNMGGITYIVFATLTVRQMLFILFKAKQVFMDNDLDSGNIITNLTMKKIYEMVGQKLNLEATDIEKLQEQKPKPKRKTHKPKTKENEPTIDKNLSNPNEDPK